MLGLVLVGTSAVGLRQHPPLEGPARGSEAAAPGDASATAAQLGPATDRVDPAGSDGSDGWSADDHDGSDASVPELLPSEAVEDRVGGPGPAPPSTAPPGGPLPDPARPAPVPDPGGRTEFPWGSGTGPVAVVSELPLDDGARAVAREALLHIRYDWQHALEGWRVRFLDERPGYRGLTYSRLRVIEVFVSPSDTPAQVAHVFAHEVGHAIDVEHFGPGERSAWSSARGLRRGTPWFVAAGGPDFASGGGDFAESFAWWQTAAVHWYSELGPPPSQVQVGLLAMLTGGS